MDDELKEALRGSAWRACKDAPEGLGLIQLARVLGVRTAIAWDVVSWLLEGGHLIVMQGQLRAVGAS